MRQLGRWHQLSVVVYDTDHGNMGSEDPVVSSVISGTGDMAQFRAGAILAEGLSLVPSAHRWVPHNSL